MMDGLLRKPHCQGVCKTQISYIYYVLLVLLLLLDLLNIVNVKPRIATKNTCHKLSLHIILVF